MIYTIIAAVFITGLIFYFSRTRGSAAASEDFVSDSQQGNITQQEQFNPYEGLRNLALNTTAAELQLTISGNEANVYAMVMDWDVGSGIATLYSSARGDASLYYSSGGGMLGGASHQNVSAAAKAFVQKAQTYLINANETETTPLPDKNCVRFCLLTNKGKFTAQENLQNFENGSSIWLPLFEEANKVISALRVVSEKK